MKRNERVERFFPRTLRATIPCNNRIEPFHGKLRLLAKTLALYKYREHRMKLPKHFWDYALLLWLCTGVISKPIYAQGFHPIKFTTYELDNGLQVILHQDTSAPVVATVVYYKVGSRDEDPKRTGFAHFFEHLMFSGTKHIPRGKLDQYVQEAGGELNAFTSQDATVYHLRLPANELALALWIEGERMRQLIIDSISVETQRKVVKEERKMRYDNSPYGGWFETMYAHLFAGSPYAWTPIGQAQHIDSAKIEEFQAFYDRYYQPNNAILVVSGDFNPDTARKYIAAYFGQYPRAAIPPRKSVHIPPLQHGYRDTIYDPKAQLPAIFIGFRGPHTGHPDAYALEMLTTILADGESSRLYRNLVDQQLAVQATAFLSDRQFAGLLVMLGIAGPGQSLDTIEHALWKEIRRIQQEGITPEEFRKARNIAEARFVAGKKQVLSKALSLATYQAYYNDPNRINSELQYYLKVTPEDIQRVAQQYFVADKAVVLRYLPAAMKPSQNQPSK